MPAKKKSYARVQFAPEVIRQAVTQFAEVERPYIAASFPQSDFATWKPSVLDISVRTRSEEWTFDSFDEALAAYRDGCLSFGFRAGGYSGKLQFQYLGYATTVEVSSGKRGDVERVFTIFEENADRSILPEVEVERRIEDAVTIFIGHGRSNAWRDLKDHLQDKHRFAVTAYETGIRAGQSIQEVLADMAKESTLALLIHTAEDADEVGLVHARENVIHETGLFQGLLGSRRAIILREDGCEAFSNIAGTQELRFSRGNIREVFGDVLAVIGREFGGK